MSKSYDVVVVGAGIAGSALASRLAQGGNDVLVLESQETYRDKIRGETIVPWGVREVGRLGIEDVLLQAGGEYTDSLVLYDETRSPEQAEERALPYSLVAPDVTGVLNVGHPEASQALSDHAVARGAVIVRGITDVKVLAGSSPAITWSDAEGTHEVRCRMIVGADGRGSAVRRQLGWEIAERDATTYGAGLLVEADGAFGGRNTFGTEGNEMFFAFPRANGFTRLYLLVDIARQRDFSGAAKTQSFLALYSKDCFPASEALATAEVAGPCGGSPMTDSWTTTPPVVEGAVLIGDAAGWNDPIIGQGLSIALRDARAVSDVMLTSDDWSPAAFDDYVQERTERMRRLAVSARIATAMRCSFDGEWRARRGRWMESTLTDPLILAQTGCALAGPEAFGPEAFTDEAVQATLTM